MFDFFLCGPGQPDLAGGIPCGHGEGNWMIFEVLSNSSLSVILWFDVRESAEDRGPAPSTTFHKSNRKFWFRNWGHTCTTALGQFAGTYQPPSIGEVLGPEGCKGKLNNASCCCTVCNIFLFLWKQYKKIRKGWEWHFLQLKVTRVWREVHQCPQRPDCEGVTEVARIRFKDKFLNTTRPYCCLGNYVIIITDL